MRPALAVLLTLVAACGADGPPSAEVGTGADRFEPLTDGEAVPIIHGLQGGYHVWGAVRARNLAGDGLHLTFTLTPVGAAWASSVRNDIVDLVSGEHGGTAVFLPDPDAVRGRPCQLRLDATDTSGRTAASERSITPE